MADGKVVIATEIDDTGFKKGMSNLASDTSNSTKKAKNSVNELGEEAKDTASDLDKLGDEFKDTKKDVEKFADSMDDAKEKSSSFGDFLKSGLIVDGISGIVSGFSGAIDEAKEYSDSLSILKTNAEDTGASFDVIQEKFKNLSAFTGDAEQSTETLSNLLQTGFDDEGIAQTVEALSGAVTKFPDTLAIEGLADGLQETLATGEATGSFAELLDRLGIGAEDFTAKLQGTTTEAEKQQLVLDTLANAGLNDLYNKYEEGNEASLKYKEAQEEINIAMSNFVEGILPFAADGFSLISDNILRLSEAFKEGGLSGLVEEAGTIISELITKITEKAPELAEAGYDLLKNFITGFFEKRDEFFEKIPEVIKGLTDKITENLPTILEKGKELILEIGTGIIEGIPVFLVSVAQIIGSIAKFIADNLPDILQFGIDILSGLIQGIINTIPELVEKLPEIISSISDGISDLAESIWDIGKNIVEGLWQGIKNAKDWLKTKITEWCGGVLDTVKEFFGIESPSKVMDKEVGQMLALGEAKGIKKKNKDVSDAIVEPFGTDFISKIQSTIPQMQSAINSALVGMQPSAYYGGATTSRETIQTINRNTTQTVKIEADAEGIYNLVRDEGRRRGVKGGVVVV